MSDNSPEFPAKRFLKAARQLNRHPRLLGPAKRTRERVMGDDDFVDRLSTARGRPADLAARQFVAFRSDAPGVAGEIALTALQAWQRLAESQGRGRGTVDVAILFTDLVGFSTWSLEAGDELAIGLLREVSEAIEPPMLERRGEVVKRLGDGLMAAFWDASSATEAAFESCERAAEIEVQGYRPRLRTGIHVGRPRKIGGDYFGIDVNIAARLAEAAEPGEILVSDSTLAALDGLALTATQRPFTAKGAPQDLAAHVVHRAG
ncbi:MAG: pH-sensitive adenylate cyclase [Solirubrobacterales bacterium]|nr:pH-sensitive adenylate cyclase [Solirubrobacterales bacterium]